MTARLFGHVCSLEVRKLISYRAVFWITSFVGFFAQLAVAYFLWDAVFAARQAREIEGMDLDAMVAYYVLAILIGRVVRGEEMPLGIATEIYDGGLSRYLVYPTSYFGVKYAQHLAHALTGVIQLVLLLALAPLLGLSFGSVSLDAVSMAIAAVVIGNVLHFALTIPLQLVAFWADNVWSLVVMLRMSLAFLGGLVMPLHLFPPWAQEVLAVLPFQFVFYFPVRTLTGDIQGEEFAGGMVVALVWVAILGVISAILWRRGGRRYTGVGM